MDKTNGVVEKLEKDEEKKALILESKKEKKLEGWVAKTIAGKKVKDGEVNSMDQFFSLGYKMLEPQIADYLLRDLEEQLIEFSKTTRVTRSGRNFSFRATVLVGDKNKYIAIGTGKDKERFSALRKASNAAKLSLTKINKGCGSWECGCSEPHSVPFRVEGKSASIRVVLIPAPKGTGLVVGDNIKDVLKFAGVKDIWSKTFGRTKTKLDFVKATLDALSKTNKVRYSNDIAQKIGGAK